MRLPESVKNLILIYFVLFFSVMLFISHYDKSVEITVIFICTQIRSGSRFTGRLLSSGDSVFYIEEPISEAIAGGEFMHNNTVFLKDIMNCNFRYYPLYYKYRTLHLQGVDLLNTIGDIGKFSEDPKNVETICKASRFRIIRLTLGRLKDLIPLISENHFNVKILSLVRDPRAIYNSKKHINGHDISRPEICDKMRDDLETERALDKNIIGRVKKLRYEDLALKPYEMVKNLYQWMGIPYTIKVEMVVSAHTQTPEEEEEVYGLRKRSKLRVINWVNEVNFSEIINLQHKCEDIFKQYNYSLVHFEHELKHLNYTVYL